MKRIVIHVTPELHSSLRQAAKDRGVSMSWFVRTAVVGSLERSGYRVDDIHPQLGGDRRAVAAGEGEE